MHANQCLTLFTMLWNNMSPNLPIRVTILVFCYIVWQLKTLIINHKEDRSLQGLYLFVELHFLLVVGGFHVNKLIVLFSLFCSIYFSVIAQTKAIGLKQRLGWKRNHVFSNCIFVYLTLNSLLRRLGERPLARKASFRLKCVIHHVSSHYWVQSSTYY